ncbi:MAG: hypothetical protein QF752_06500 [Planctomycetota bacterium]|jgi:hypothetical protein|nr:hypothetical protein [Planctomycetota bacterium]
MKIKSLANWMFKKAIENPFAIRVAYESHQHRTLREAGKPIPWNLRVYARLSGLFLLVANSALAYAAHRYTKNGFDGEIYFVTILLCGIFSLLGFVQLLTGTHFSTYR